MVMQHSWQATETPHPKVLQKYQLNHKGIGLARCTVERLMKRLEFQGVRLNKVVPCPLERIHRQFKAD
jgi:putative transposase